MTRFAHNAPPERLTSRNGIAALVIDHGDQVTFSNVMLE